MAIEKYELPLKEIIPISEGGTGASTAEQALKNLGGDTKFNCNVGEWENNVDLNNYITQGVYLVGKGGSTAESWKGIDGTNGILEVWTNNAGNTKQRLTRWGTSGVNDHMTFLRQGNNKTGWGGWKRIDNGGAGSVLANTGYYKTVDGLVFAWNSRVSFYETSIAVITKSIPFTTYLAIPVDTFGEESVPGGLKCQHIAWRYGASTDTTDTFQAVDNATGAFSVFWIGKVV